MHIKAKVILGSVTALTILSVLLIDTGSAHTRSAVAGGFSGAYGFRPGEWQFVTTTTGPLLAACRTFTGQSIEVSLFIIQYDE